MKAAATEATSAWRAWTISLRLQTLPLACCGILLGSALAVASGATPDRAVFALALITAVLLQLLANLANDYGDFSKSADTSARLGPQRGMQMGMISLAQMRRALWFTATLCLLAGGALLTIACRSTTDMLVFLGLGKVSIIAALTYTLGRHAYGYLGLGDLSVLVFFGLVAVGGSYYLQTGRIDPHVTVPAIGCGLLSVLVLNVNNMRDMDEDRKHGKITLAIRLGARRARYYHLLVLLAGLGALAWTAWHSGQGRLAPWGFLLMAPLAVSHASTMLHYAKAEELRAQLPVSVSLNILSIGLLALDLIFR
ncbi:MAG: 1,4-dihydroxy-2-naphthoate octaprenyltransferase [Xanthomonadaceae bacterium]|jgi:1,4-dihydroxy-2-naphthoate octaprenyltransferase|nr:1,4-dihydroxy-2-naphthoate octaprenyltransferase [Xanthomonadaceae bacterium]